MGLRRLIGRTKGGISTKLHTTIDANGRPLNVFTTAGHVGDYTGAAVLLEGLPEAQGLLGECGHDADWFITLFRVRAFRPAFRAADRAGEPAR